MTFEMYNKQAGQPRPNRPPRRPAGRRSASRRPAYVHMHVHIYNRHGCGDFLYVFQNFVPAPARTILPFLEPDLQSPTSGAPPQEPHSERPSPRIPPLSSSSETHIWKPTSETQLLETQLRSITSGPEVPAEPLLWRWLASIAHLPPPTPQWQSSLGGPHLPQLPCRPPTPSWRRLSLPPFPPPAYLEMYCALCAPPSPAHN